MKLKLGLENLLACQGVHLYVQDREKFQPIMTTLHLVACVRSTYPDHFAWREPWVSGGHYPIDLLSGGSAVREHLDANKPIPDLVDGWKEALDAFLRQACPLSVVSQLTGQARLVVGQIFERTRASFGGKNGC